MVNTDNEVERASGYLKQWLETTRRYLFSDPESLVDAEQNELIESTLDEHGARDRTISRARGRSLRPRLL